MGTRRARLNATINAITLNLNNKQPQTGEVLIPGFKGDRLYPHVTSDGTTLTITVNNRSGKDVSAQLGASKAEVVINLGVPAPPIIIPGINYRAGQPIRLVPMVTSDLTQAIFVFTDKEIHQGDVDAELDFILVQGDSLQEPRYRLEWIQNPIIVEHAALRGEAGVVEPSDIGGAMGPMGLTIP